MEQQENEPHRMTNKELFERQMNIPREIERLDRANCAL